MLNLPFAYKPDQGTPDPSVPIKFYRYLRYKKPYMIGSDVKHIQTRLRELGFDSGTIDGVFGKNTENAIKAFQNSRKITVDGIVGPETWNYIMKADNLPVLERYLKYTIPNMTGNDVKVVQTRLKELRFNPGIIDGVFGRNTESAVKKFQSSKRLTTDGIIGPKTWNYLFK